MVREIEDCVQPRRLGTKTHLLAKPALCCTRKRALDRHAKVIERTAQQLPETDAREPLTKVLASWQTAQCSLQWLSLTRQWLQRKFQVWLEALAKSYPNSLRNSPWRVMQIQPDLQVIRGRFAGRCGCVWPKVMLRMACTLVVSIGHVHVQLLILNVPTQALELRDSLSLRQRSAGCCRKCLYPKGFCAVWFFGHPMQRMAAVKQIVAAV
mmetsp:Transcript_124216/g.310521  ORF Transcript_124216/g.310521 Transcript_124216/m.310521 type:complete len:210 (-) Transcript_124216:377-1006(-)